MTKQQKAAGGGAGVGPGSGSGSGVVFDGRDYSEKSTAARTIRQVGGKDRHSKVVTWRGPRDRRIRLSVATAIQLYDVQDRLGYDQPSKAVEWLLSKAKPSIHALPLLHHSTISTGKAKIEQEEEEEVEEEEEEEEEEVAGSSCCEQAQLKSNNTPPNVEQFLWTSPPPNQFLHGLIQHSMSYNYPQLPSSSSLSQVAMSRLDPFMPIPNGSSSVNNNELNEVVVEPIMSAHQLHNEHLLSLLSKPPSLFHPSPCNSSSSTSRPPLYHHLQNSSHLDNHARGHDIAGSGYAACYSINSGSAEEQANYSGSLISALGIPHRSIHNSAHNSNTTSNITFFEHQLKRNSNSTTRYSTELRHDGVDYIGQASNTSTTDISNFDPRTFDYKF